MKRLGLLALLLSGCYLPTSYEPAVCLKETVDTVLILQVGDGPYSYVTETRCDEWVALSDSTKRWDNDGRRLP